MNESQHIRKGEAGQTSAEYVAVTVIAVGLALGLVYLVLQASLAAAAGDIGDAIADFIAGELP